MKLIPLSQGKFAMVPDDAYAWLMQWKWHAHKDDNTFYAVRNVRKPDGTRTLLRMHRVILGITDSEIEVDHRDGNGLDNRRSNLRVATHGQNQWNQGEHKDNTSGVRGVCWEKRRNKWRARIRVNGKHLFLGHFTNLEDAKQARLAAEIQYHGEFAAVLSRKKPPQSVTAAYGVAAQ